VTDREIRPAGRFEWEQIILRSRLGGVIQGNGRGTRGGVSATTLKAVALVWASHADIDGTQIWPGDATVAVEAEAGLQVVQACKRALVDLGLMEKVRSRARRRHRGDEYRLTLPSDLLDRLEVLNPAQLKVAAGAEYEKRRGKRGGSAGPLSPPVGSEPVGGPADTPQADPDESRGGSSGTTNEPRGGSAGTSVGGPAERDTNQDPATYLRPTQTDDEIRTALTGPRATAAEEQISPDEVADRPTAGPRRCEPHRLAGGRRNDGRPNCPLCRVAEDQAAGRRRAIAEPERGGTVVAFPRRTA